MIGSAPRSPGLPATGKEFVKNGKPKNDKRPTPETIPATKEPTVVGIGASAGGLTALKHLFEHLPPDSGLAFVVVVHLSPEHKSYLTDLLQPTVRFPVQQVTENTLLEPNHVYVIPPNANLSAIDTHLRLSRLEESRRGRAPIDHFFRTLAETYHDHAIGVILTGTGSDGTLGLKEIKAQGGLIIVQDPNEAEFDGMPQSAIATGLVDRVLPVAEISEALLRYSRTDPHVSLPEDGREGTLDERTLLPKILAILKARTERDFSRYKPSTILRRIARRMQLNYMEDFNHYFERVKENAEEARALADDLLINVTSFFRDPEVYKKLEEIAIPRIFENKGPKDVVRVWSVGCATGEETYSLAMLLIEAAGHKEAPPQIQVFGSDLHKRSLDSAREGVYAGDIEAEVSPERLMRFFQKENGSYRIRKEVRDLVVFAPHNLLGDPPFSRINLISCRNLLIYLDRSVQHDVIDLFHYSLCPDGYLLLGSSETVESSELFKTEDKKTCLFRKRNVPAPEPRLPVFPNSRLNHEMLLVSRQGLSPGTIPYGTLHQIMLERYAPPSILVGPDDILVHLSENAGKYLVHPGGAITSSVVKLVREELRIELRSLLLEAREKQEPLESRAVPVRFNGHSTPVVMQVRPAREAEQEGFVLIIFHEQPDLKEDDVAAKSGETLAEGQDAERTSQLEAEIRVAYQRLQAIIEEYETNREEMKASNEEMQSSNEELRSTMEELETSKEELQSINEELQTVNQENRHKVEELSQLSSDLQNLLAATGIATLFLDRELRILRFTPRVAVLFNVRTTDRGRPISDLTHRLGYAQLRSDAEEVLSHLIPVEREIQDDAGHWYLARILPYRSTEDRIEGIVLTFIDITVQKMAENLARASARELFAEGTWLRTVLDSLNDGILATDAESRLRYLNPAAEHLTGWLLSEAAGKPIKELYDPRTITGRPVDRSSGQKALSAGSNDGKRRFLLRTRAGQTTPIEDASTSIIAAGHIEGVVTIVSNISERMNQERLREDERERLGEQIQKTTELLGQTRADLKALSSYLLKAHEEERRRLARELHDDFGQRMSILGMSANRAIGQLRENPKATEEALQSISREVSLLSQGLREMSHRLHPSALEDLGLISALRGLITGIRDEGAEVSSTLPEEIPALTADEATAFYRIAQEALTNAMKHAPGAPIHVTLAAQDNSVKLTIRDGGPGFDVTNVRLGGGLGVLNMNARALLINATLIVDSLPGEGTVVTVQLATPSPV